MTIEEAIIHAKEATKRKDMCAERRAYIRGAIEKYKKNHR